jgi:hypothetical protein
MKRRVPSPSTMCSLALAPHRGRERLVVSDYFLVEDLAPGGVVHAEGDHRIHVFNVGPNRLELDRRFDLDFNRDIGTGPARPHGMATFHARAK